MFAHGTMTPTLLDVFILIVLMLLHVRSQKIFKLFLTTKTHYVRKPHPRCVCTKKGDMQITHLHRCISYYRVIGDTCLGASPISIHWRHTKLERVSHYTTHPRHTLIVRITDLIAEWGP
jgi:hypothetical protein